MCKDNIIKFCSQNLSAEPITVPFDTEATCSCILQQIFRKISKSTWSKNL